VRKFEKLFKELKQAKERNVDIKIAAPLDPKLKKLVSEMSAYAEVKHTDASARFVVVDGKQLVFMVTHDREVNPSYDLGYGLTPLLCAEHVLYVRAHGSA